jgi:hypothetical protein
MTFLFEVERKTEKSRWRDFFRCSKKRESETKILEIFATLNASVFGFRLSGKRTTPHNYSSYDSVVCARELLRARRRRDKLHLSA